MKHDRQKEERVENLCNLVDVSASHWLKNNTAGVHGGKIKEKKEEKDENKENSAMERIKERKTRRPVPSKYRPKRIRHGFTAELHFHKVIQGVGDRFLKKKHIK